MAWRPEPGWLWAATALPLFAGYGLAIPNLLGPALRRYGHCLGRAGALFGLAYYSLLGVGFGHLLMALPYSVIALLVAYARLDQSLYKASRSLGAGLWPTLWNVLLPNVRGGVAGGFFMGFVMSWEEVVVTLFTSGLNVVTLPKRIWDGLRYNLDPAIAAVSTLMIVLTLVVMLVRLYLARHQPPS